MNLSLNQLAVKFLYIERPYLNYNFVSEEEKWYDRFNIPELENDKLTQEQIDRGEEPKNFLEKFHPINCVT